MSQPAARGRVVLIEDNGPIERLVRLILAGEGYEVYVAKAGHAGVELVGEHAPDLVLCDLDLPDMDGFEVLKLIRALDTGRHQKVVAFTVFAMDEDRRRIEDAGFDGCITKPLEPTDFLSDVMALVGS